MNHKLLFLNVLAMIFTLTSCVKNNASVKTDEVWTISFDTSKVAGICYFTSKDPIYSQEGHLTFQNRNDFSIHVTLFNNDKKGKIEYEADIDGGGILSYNNIDPESEYIVRVRVLDGEGADKVTVMVYGNSSVLPYVLNEEKD